MSLGRKSPACAALFTDFPLGATPASALSAFACLPGRRGNCHRTGLECYLRRLEIIFVALLWFIMIRFADRGRAWSALCDASGEPAVSPTWKLCCLLPGLHTLGLYVLVRAALMVMGPRRVRAAPPTIYAFCNTTGLFRTHLVFGGKNTLGWSCIAAGSS